MITQEQIDKENLKRLFVNINGFPTYLGGVEFDVKDGKHIDDGWYTHGTKVTLTAKETIVGYDFKYWDINDIGRPIHPNDLRLSNDDDCLYLRNVLGLGQSDDIKKYFDGIVLDVESDGYKKALAFYERAINPTITFDMTKSADVCAWFNIKSVRFSVKPQNQKMGYTSGGGCVFYGTEMDIWAKPNEGYEFTQWLDGVKENPRHVEFTKDIEYIALFKKVN